MTRRQIVVVLACVAAASLATFIGTLALLPAGAGRFVVSCMAAATTGAVSCAIWRQFAAGARRTRRAPTWMALSALAGAAALAGIVIPVAFAAITVSGSGAVHGHGPEGGRHVGPPMSAGAGSSGNRLETPVPGQAAGIERGVSLMVLLAIASGQRRGDAR